MTSIKSSVIVSELNSSKKSKKITKLLTATILGAGLILSSGKAYGVESFNSFSYDHGIVRDLLKSRIGNNASNNIVTQNDFNRSKGNIDSAVNGLNNGDHKAMLFGKPDHATALLLVKQGGGQVKAIFNDPMGNAIPGTLSNYLASKNISIEDLQTTIQRGGTNDCGILTIETLEVLSETNNLSGLSKEQLQAIVSPIGLTSVENIRIKHLIHILQNKNALKNGFGYATYSANIDGIGQILSKDGSISENDLRKALYDAGMISIEPNVSTTSAVSNSVSNTNVEVAVSNIITDDLLDSIASSHSAQINENNSSQESTNSNTDSNQSPQPKKLTETISKLEAVIGKEKTKQVSGLLEIAEKQVDQASKDELKKIAINISRSTAAKKDFEKRRISMTKEDIVKEVEEEINHEINQIDSLIKIANRTGDVTLLKQSEEIKKNVQKILVKAIDEAKSADELPSIIASEEATTDGITAANNAVASVVASRASMPLSIGLASGDEDESIQYGAWVKGLFSTAEQTQDKLVPGYKLTQGGGVIGFDIGEDYILGISYSLIKSKINAKKIKRSEDITTHIGSVYAAANFTNNMIASAQIYMGKSNISKERTDNTKNKYKATTSATLMGGSAEVGYKYIYTPMNIALIPTIGIAYDSIDVSGYKEKAESGVCKEVKKREVSKTSLVTGLVLKNKKRLDSGLYLNSELKSRFSYILSSNNSNTVSKIADTIEISTKGQKGPKYNMDFGGSVGVSSNKGYDLSVGYELGLAKKFISHTGFVSTRVRF